MQLLFWFSQKTSLPHSEVIQSEALQIQYLVLINFGYFFIKSALVILETFNEGSIKKTTLVKRLIL